MNRPRLYIGMSLSCLTSRAPSQIAEGSIYVACGGDKAKVRCLLEWHMSFSALRKPTVGPGLSSVP